MAEQRKKIALTFDDGPGKYTDRILDILDEHNVKASFFVIGERLYLQHAIIQRIHCEGHLLGNHTWSHKDLTALSEMRCKLEILHSHLSLADIENIPMPRYLRPPFGAIDAEVLRVCQFYNMIPVLWDSEGRDWSNPGVDAIVGCVLATARNSGIILLHDGSAEHHDEEREQTIEALPRIIVGLRSMGYDFVRVDDIDSPCVVRSAGQLPRLKEMRVELDARIEAVMSDVVVR